MRTLIQEKLGGQLHWDLWVFFAIQHENDLAVASLFDDLAGRHIRAVKRREGPESRCILGILLREPKWVIGESNQPKWRGFWNECRVSALFWFACGCGLRSGRKCEWFAQARRFINALGGASRIFWPKARQQLLRACPARGSENHGCNTN